MTLNDAPVLASLSGGSLLALALFGAAATSGLVATLLPRRRRSAPSLPPLPQQWDHELVIAAPRARDLVSGAPCHAP